MTELMAINGYHAPWRLAVTLALFAHTSPKQEGMNGLLLSGKAGTGKTFCAESFAKCIGAEFRYIQFDKTTNKEDIVYAEDIPRILRAVATGDTDAEDIWESNMVIPRAIPLAMEESHNNPVVLLLDEFEKSRSDVDALMLDILQKCKLHVAMQDPETGSRTHVVTANKENLFIMITKNDERPLSEPLMRRLRRITLNYPSPDIETAIVRERHPDAPKELVSFLISISNEMRKGSMHKAPSTQEIMNCVNDLMVLTETDLGSTVGSFGHVIYSWLVAYENDIPHANKVVSENRCRDMAARIMRTHQIHKGETVEFTEALEPVKQEWEAK
jgi:MoxR-like ATPase